MVAQHHDEGGISFNEGAFHKAIFNKVSEVLVYVKAHVHRRQNNCFGVSDLAWSYEDVFVYGYTCVFASEAVDSYDALVLVFCVGGPGYGGCGSFTDDFYNVASGYAELLHCLLVDASDASAHITLAGVSNSKLNLGHGFSLL
jgi:hypothetical protein